MFDKYYMLLFQMCSILNAMGGSSNRGTAAPIKTAFHIDVVHFLSHCGIWMGSAVISQIEALLSFKKSMSPEPHLSLLVFSHDHMAPGERRHHKISIILIEFIWNV